jgi:hypothetical protein
MVRTFYFPIEYFFLKKEKFLNFVANGALDGRLKWIVYASPHEELR